MERRCTCDSRRNLLLIVLICVFQGAFFFLVLDSSTLSQQSEVSQPVHVPLEGSLLQHHTTSHRQDDNRVQAGIIHNYSLSVHTLLSQSKIMKQPGNVPGRQSMRLPGDVPRRQRTRLPVDVQGRHRMRLPVDVQGRQRMRLPGDVPGRQIPRLPGDVPGRQRMRLPGDVQGRLSKSSYNCSDEVCSSLLQHPSRMCYLQCGELAQLRAQVSYDDTPKRCKFRESRGRVPVALVSVPGSGNTWIRGLLEKATGVCTGSIYCDIPLRIKGFVGESVRDGGVLVVKTHTSDYQWMDMQLKRRNQDDSFYSSAILLIRNPFDTFVSERQRSFLLERAESEALKADRRYGVGKVKHKDGSHVHASDKEAFGNVSNWKEFSHNFGKRWQKTIVEWSTSNRSVLVVRYEDLRNDCLLQVTRMLEFLNHDYNRMDLAVKLKSGFTEFQRSHTDGNEHYSSEQKKEINAMIMATLTTLRAHHLDHLFQIKDYMSISSGR